MASFGTGNPFTEDFRLLRGIPANLGGAASIAANDILVAASRNDQWIRAASTATTPGFVPAFTRATVNVAFDFYLCSGNGSPVPNDVVEIIFPASVTNAATVVTGPGAALLLDEAIATAIATSPLVQGGRRAIIQSSNVGRVTGTIVLSSDANVTAVVKYRHIITSVVIRVAAT